jgi:predicted  nucleic acid-binding Zn-ribbon protein
MPGLDENIKRINNKLHQLMKQYHQLQKENERKSNEIKELKELKENQSQQIATLQQQLMILKSAAGEIKEKDKKEFEKHINQYIKEIDKCIGWLSE